MLNILIPARYLDKTSTSSSSALSKTSALNKLIFARHHTTSTKSALSKIILPVPVPVPTTKSDLPSQNKMSNQLRNLVNNHTSKENGKIDIGTIPLPNSTKLIANSVYESKTAAQLQQYHHSIMGALPVKTYIAAIKEGWLSSFPGLLVEAVHKHLPKSVQSVIRHLHMIRKGIRPTPGDKTVEINELMNESMKPDYDENICQELPLKRNHKVGVSVFQFDELNEMISTDLPGRFPTISSRGNVYILVM